MNVPVQHTAGPFLKIRVNDGDDNINVGMSDKFLCPWRTENMNCDYVLRPHFSLALWSVSGAFLVFVLLTLTQFPDQPPSLHHPFYCKSL